MEDSPPSPAPKQSQPNEFWAFCLILANSAILLVVGFALSLLFKVTPHEHLNLSLQNVAYGLLAVIPLAGFLFWFMRTDIKSFSTFRTSQIEFFANLGFRFTLVRILMISLAAGIFEEYLFRGVLQVALYPLIPVSLAILLPNIIFGLLHMRTIIYALLAGVVGTYLGLVFVVTGSLAAAMVCHTVYDIMALEVTRRAIAARQSKP